MSSKLQFRYGHTAEYLYDASGNKHQVKHTTTNQNLSVGWGSFWDVTAAQKASEKVTDYCGDVIYENGVLSMIRTPEGYITLSGTTPTYHYYLRDHLGNNRVVVNQSATVTQVNHYYPSGGVFEEGTATSTQPYKYNDKELDQTNGLDLYDYSARFMDAALGQFTTVDPLAEKYYSISPYAYVGNNPMKFIDPDGKNMQIPPVPYPMPYLPPPIGTNVKNPSHPNNLPTIEQMGKDLKQFVDKKINDIIGSTLMVTLPAFITVYEATSNAEKKDLKEENDEGSKSGSIKNEKHGDSGRAKTKSERQISDLKQQLEGATKKEKQLIERKIRNIRNDAYRKSKGEEHSRGVKR